MEQLTWTGQRAQRSQPFSALMEARLVSLLEGEAVFEVPIRNELLQQDGSVHGGVIGYLADNALTFAGGSVLGPAVLTSEYKINYLRPASGQTLVARASVVYAGKRQAVCRCDIFAAGADGGETFCAAAQGTIASVAAPKRARQASRACRASSRRRTTARAKVRRPWTRRLLRRRTWPGAGTTCHNSVLLNGGCSRH